MKNGDKLGTLVPDFRLVRLRSLRRPYVGRSRTARRVLRLEGHILTFAEEIEAVLRNGTAVEENVLPAIGTDKTETTICLDLVYLSLHT